MKFKSRLLYPAVLIFAIWCGAVFRADLAQLSWSAIWATRYAVLLAAALSLLNYLGRAWRWDVYLKALGFHLASRYVVLTFAAGFAFTLSPGKVGEMARARYYQRDHAMPLSVTAAAFFIERLMDVLAMACLALLGLAAASNFNWLLAAAAVMLLGLLVLARAPWYAWQQRFSAGSGEHGGALRRALDSALKTLVSARVLLRPRLALGAFALGLLSWGLEGVGLWLLAQQLAPSVELHLATAIGIYAIAIIAGALSFLPGGLGGTEVVMAALLGAQGVTPASAIMITLVCRVVTLWLAVAIGWLAVAALRQPAVPNFKEA
ncbi:flippase-like domain-containing protein [Duganella sp. SAP-35]|uniref:Flippase-like domain-containing protein n=1 Tax=Duganella aceris TaxID=2703883 RepID=A0ABX0FUB4_9BURK|nr:flippase-like domain-containing protein [Duganella aceris]